MKPGTNGMARAGLVWAQRLAALAITCAVPGAVAIHGLTSRSFTPIGNNLPETAILSTIGAGIGAMVFENGRPRGGGPAWHLWGTLAILALGGGAAAFTDAGSIALIWSAILLPAAIFGSIARCLHYGRSTFMALWIASLVAVLAFEGIALLSAVGVRGPQLSPGQNVGLVVLFLVGAFTGPVGAVIVNVGRFLRARHVRPRSRSWPFI